MDFVRQSHLYHHLPYRMPLQYRLSYPLVPSARCTCECYCMGSQRPRFDVMEKAAASGFELSGADSKHLEAGMENDVFNPDKSGRRNRTTYKRWQIDELERAFVMNPYPTSVFKKTLAMRLGLRDSRVQVWFQNRRAKSKRETKGPRDSFNNDNVNDTDFHTDHALLYNEALTEQLHINVTEPSD